MNLIDRDAANPENNSGGFVVLQIEPSFLQIFPFCGGVANRPMLSSSAAV
jgi:hypothetical protein